jgi:glucuronate isomerase
MRPYIHDDFLLPTEAARALYHGFAKHAPCYDYHGHLSAAAIADNRGWSDLADLWLAGDHYKWRAMRIDGVDERFCTGDASPREKCAAWCATVPQVLGHPLYAWSHLEMARTFGFFGAIDAHATEPLWAAAQERLRHWRAHDALREARVVVLCTTDDPADSLAAHERLAADRHLPFRVYPTFRPDTVFAVDAPAALNPWLEKLADAADLGAIATLDDLQEALQRRHAAFHAVGGRLSDHGLETLTPDAATRGEAAAIFAAARAGRTASPEATGRYAGFWLRAFARWDAARGWTKQLHLGARRNVRSRLFRSVGADTIGDGPRSEALVRLLDDLDAEGALPRMVIYNHDPSANARFAALVGSFHDGTIPGKIQWGPAWWLADHAEGIRAQLDTLARLGSLARFVGMTTDSRSFLSFSRHEYFRRVLCRYLGELIDAGEMPSDTATTGALVRAICFDNARAFFGLTLPEDCQSDL